MPKGGKQGLRKPRFSADSDEDLEEKEEERMATIEGSYFSAKKASQALNK